jgi:hypothetical protein
MMRHITWGLAWLVLLLGVLATPAFGQTRGGVESIGFDNVYRPDCWTPMRVKILPEQSGTFQIQIYQSDLDADLPVYTRTITLTAASEGGGDQRFWAYFLPQPIDGGLLDQSRGGSTAQLQQQVKVFLADEHGRQIIALGITAPITNIEPPRSTLGPFGVPRGTKLIVAVTEGRSQPAWKEYSQSIGIMEDVYVADLRPDELPEGVRGYDAVDAIVWFDVSPPDASNPSGEAVRRAIQQYVAAGGQLVIIQSPERDATRGWGELLPVRVMGIEGQEKLDPLPEMAQARGDSRWAAEWAAVPGPFRMARGECKAGAVAEWPIHWDSGGPDTPMVARRLFGAGSVTWVAYDVGDPSLTVRARRGWPHVWDRILNWRNDTRIVDNQTPSAERDLYAAGNPKDIGPITSAGIEAPGKSRAFVGLAVVFFIVYWLVAGPGSYFYLAARARAHLSWFLFALSAIAATAVTVLMVEAVVRGDPELWHVSLVRQAWNEPAIITSRFGLYIPKSGMQDLELLDADIRFDSYISPLPIHPEYVTASPDFPPMSEYPVEVRDPGSGQRVTLSVPFRSTLKKLQARWVGPLAGTIQGQGKLGGESGQRISGTLTNATGRSLKNVFICYRNLLAGQDELLYIPAFEDRNSIDLARETDYSRTRFVAAPGETSAQAVLPDRGAAAQGSIHARWVRNWYYPLRSSGFGSVELHNDASDSYKRTIPMLSFFCRLPPAQNSPQSLDRFELLRRNARHFDISQAVSAGALVVLAESREPLPIPLLVNGDRIGGEGTTYYQFVLPLDRSAERLSEQQPESPAP